jgi:hypothetical protein
MLEGHFYDSQINSLFSFYVVPFNLAHILCGPTSTWLPSTSAPQFFYPVLQSQLACLPLLSPYFPNTLKLSAGQFQTKS